MPTQYVMKATHINSAPLGTVFWVVTGAPDNTGVQSGYNPADLTSIGVDYTTTVSATTVGAGGTTLLVPVRYTPLDSSTIINWKLDETAAPLLNSGNGGTLNLTNGFGSPAPNATGLFNQAVSFSASSGLTSGDTTIEPTANNCTVSLWVYANTINNNANIYAKAYNAGGTWTPPYFSLYMNMAGNTSGDWFSGITVGGTNFGVFSGTGRYAIKTGQWTLLSHTFDGSNLRTYINGNIVSTVSAPGSIGFNTHGPYNIGGLVGSQSQVWDGLIEDFRVENTVRSQAYFEAMYKNGAGQYDGSFGNPILSILSDGYANLPPAGLVGRLFLPTDAFATLRDNGTSWAAFSDVELTECGNRLTLASATPVTITDQTAKSIIYFTPHDGNRIALYNGNYWATFAVNEISITLSALTSGKNYDVFIYSNAGTATLELSAAWTTDTARADALARQDGVLVKSSDHKRRYLGTFRTTGTTTTEDSVLKRFLWNLHRQLPRPMNVNDPTNSWTYNSSTWRQARATATNKFEYVCGADETYFQTILIVLTSASTATGSSVGVGIDSTTVNSAQLYGSNAFSSVATLTTAKYDGYPGLGYHSINWIEAVTNGNTITFYGNAGDTNLYRFGMSGTIAG